jgi:hypothetical protein
MQSAPTRLGVVRDVHAGWAWFVIVANAVVGAWSLAAHKVGWLRTRALWWCTLAAELALFVQVFMGVWLVSRDNYVVEQFHMFYGFVAIIAVGILYSYRQQMRRQVYLLYGFGGLFLMGLCIRAMLVGRA